MHAGESSCSSTSTSSSAELARRARLGWPCEVIQVRAKVCACVRALELERPHLFEIRLISISGGRLAGGDHKFNYALHWAPPLIRA